MKKVPSQPFFWVEAQGRKVQKYTFGGIIKKSPEDEWFVSVREGNFVRPPGGRHSRESAIRRFRRTRIGSEVELVLPVKARIT